MMTILSREHISVIKSATYRWQPLVKMTRSKLKVNQFKVYTPVELHICDFTGIFMALGHYVLGLFFCPSLEDIMSPSHLWS